MNRARKWTSLILGVVFLQIFLFLGYQMIKDPSGSTSNAEEMLNKFCPMLKGANFEDGVEELNEEIFEQLVEKWQKKVENSCCKVANEIFHRPMCWELAKQLNITTIDPVNYFPCLTYEPTLEVSELLSKFLHNTNETAIKIASSQTTMEKEEPVIAYFIMGYDRPLEQLIRLIDSVWHESNIYLIHIDVKMEKNKFELQKHLKKNPTKYSNVFVMYKSFDIDWGATGIALATLEGMFQLLDLNKAWNYFINLSDSDYPICSQPLLAKKLKPFLATNTNFDIGWMEDLPLRGFKNTLFSVVTETLLFVMYLTTEHVITFLFVFLKPVCLIVQQ